MQKPGKIGMLVRADNCIGCGTCQIACQEQNGLDITETWLELVRRYPKEIDGELRMRHVVIPEIDKCNECVKSCSPDAPLCTISCPLSCITIDEIGELMDKMRAAEFGCWQLTI